MSDRYLLVLWLTGKCNLHCSYCYAGGNPAPFDMEFSTAKAAIDRLSDHPLKIQFAGGEPLLNFPLAEQIVNYVNQRKLDAVFQLQTNGTLLTEELARKLKALGISVGVSLDGIPEVNNRTRGKTLEAVNGIRALGRAGTTVGINAVVTAETVEQLPKLVDFALYLGNIGGIGLDLLRFAGRGEGNLPAGPQQLEAALTAMHRRTKELKALTGRSIQLREIELAKRRLRSTTPAKHYCYAACGRSVVVLPDGSTYPCGSLLQNSYFMGPVQSLTPQHILSIPSAAFSGCGTCPYEAHCPKGCPSRKIRNENDLDCVLLKTAFRLAEREMYETTD